MKVGNEDGRNGIEEERVVGRTLDGIGGVGGEDRGEVGERNRRRVELTNVLSELRVRGYVSLRQTEDCAFIVTIPCRSVRVSNSSSE